MKNRHFRIITLFGLLSILGVGILQFFWFKQAYNVRKKEFELKVVQALTEVAEEIYIYNGSQQSSSYPIEQLSENYFVVMINDHIDVKLLNALLKRKFNEKYINTAYTYTIYDCASDNLVYGSKTQDLQKGEEQIKLPKWNKDQYYFGVYFPNIEPSLLSGMGGWFLLSVILLIVLLFFGFSLMILFRQKRLSEIQKDFVNNMTHELKTPLSSIQLSSDHLLHNYGNEERDHKYLEIINYEAKKLKVLIERVLEQARGRNEGIKIEKEKLNIHNLIKNICEKTEISSQSRFQYKIQNETENGTILGDSFHLQRVFENLLDNSIKYSEQVSEIIVKIKSSEKNLIIEWSDNGKGIEFKYRNRIFKPFFRIKEGDRHDSKGYGLGLHYVKNVIEKHKGRVSWKSISGRKGYFEIIIPKGNA